MNETDIDKIFAHHPPLGEEIVAKHSAVRKATKNAAKTILQLTPPSAEQTLAIRALQQAMMYANAAIAIHSED